MRILRPARPSRRPAPARSSEIGWWKYAIAGLGIILTALVTWHVVISQRLEWSIRRGLAACHDAQSLEELQAALAQWEQDTGPYWRRRRDDLVDRLLNEQNLSRSGAADLLAWVTGADYRDRGADWARWYEARQRLRQGRQPTVTRREHVTLKTSWQAPVGLTAWFTTILPLNGRIYVPSLGAALDDPLDQADGLVIVDGKTGAAELAFVPDAGPVRDVIGLAAGADCLFVTCRNGFVYCLTPDAKALWSFDCGAALASVPLSLEVNRDATPDGLAVTEGGTLLAIDGRTGKRLWHVSLSSGPTEPGPLVRYALAAGDVLGEGKTRVLAAGDDGSLAVLSPSDGKVRWHTRLAAGTLAGGVIVERDFAAGPPTYIADQSALIWSLVASRDQPAIVPTWEAGLRPTARLLAAPRTVLTDAASPPWIVSCQFREDSGLPGSVCALSSAGIEWRYAADGEIWAPPAIADLNADGSIELLVASADRDRFGRSTGSATVLSHRGHCLRRFDCDAALECPPVVADVDCDGRLEILLADRAGQLRCLDTSAFGPVEWGLAGGDPRNTRNAGNAYSFGQTYWDRQWSWRPRHDTSAGRRH